MAQPPPSVRHHIKLAWIFEEFEAPLALMPMLLACVSIAKIENKDQLLAVLGQTPVRED